MLEIKFTNLSEANFYQSVTGATTTVMDSQVQAPSKMLNAGGRTADIWDNEFKLGYGALTYWSCWSYPETELRFGVRVVDLGQPGGLGARPTWDVMWDINTVNPEPDWKPNGSVPADPFNWPTSVGFNIKAVATSTHTGLAIAVGIQDLAP